MRRARAGVVAALTAVACVCAPAARGDGQPPKVMFVVDSSSSMADPEPSGGSRMSMTKAALQAAVAELGENSSVGLRSLGGGKQTGDNKCNDSTSELDLATVDKDKFNKAVDALQPGGDSPITFALSEAASALGSDGQRRIILVADAKESCEADPCATVKELMAGGLQVDVVGISPDTSSREQFQCIANAGGGSYYEVSESSALKSVLTRLGGLTQLPAAAGGTAIAGAEAIDSAPGLAAGSYSEVLTGDTTKFYKVKRQWPNSSLHVSAVSRPVGGSGTRATSTPKWEFKLAIPGGETCAEELVGGADSKVGGPMVSKTLVSLQPNPMETPSDVEKQCAEATELAYELTRTSSDASTSTVEFHITEEPPIDNAPSLPSGVVEVKTDTSVKAPTPGEASAVIGGSGFNDARELGPGTYVTELLPGDRVFFKTRMDFGQSAVMSTDDLTVENSVLDAIVTGQASAAPSVYSDLYAPDLSRMNSQDSPSAVSFTKHASGGLKAADTRILRVPEIRFRNRWESPPLDGYPGSRSFSMGGYYYYVVGLGTQETLKGKPAKVTFTIGMTGGTAPQPSSSVTPAPTNQVSSKKAAAKWILIIGGVAIVLVGGVGMTVAVRRRNG